MHRFVTALILIFIALLTCKAAPDSPTPPGPVVATSATRAEIVLNGLWRWLPAAAPSATEPAGAADWGLIWVPGVWGTRMWGHYKNSEPGSAVPGVQKAGKGAEWKDWNETLRAGWFEREVTVPAEWEGRAITLTFDRLATDAEVWLDGRKAGHVAWPGGEIDLTAVAKPGNVQRLRVRVAAVQTAQDAIDYMGVGQNTATKASLDLRGISGDVVLAAHPKGERVTDVFVKTSTREKRLAVDVELAGVRPGQKLAITALVRAAMDGAVIRTFTSDEITAAAPDANAAPESSAVIRDLGWAWPDARLWEIDDPFLHRLELQIRSAGKTAEVAPLDAWGVNFGFREFWVEGRDFYLNGTRIRLRPALQGGVTGGFAPPEALAAEFARWRGHGRNFVEVWPSPKDRGARVPDVTVAEAADRSGMLLALPAVRINEFAMGPGYRPIWDTPAGRDTWRPLFQADWRKLRNHPSIVMIGLSGNFGGHNHDQDPRWLGRRQVPPGQKAQPAQAEADKIAAAFDPTRARWHHQGGACGDVFTVNHYLNFIPLQEREEWLSEWARSGDMPYASVEFGTPFNASFLRGRDGFGNSIGSEPFLAEYAAIYLGPEAYRLQGDDYVRAVRGRFEQGDATRNGRWASWQNRPEMHESPAFQAIQELFVTNTWRAWRTDGVSGGMIPWDDIYFVASKNLPRVALEWRPGRRGWFVPELPGSALRTSFHDAAAFRLHPAGQALEAVNGPTLAWIAGAPGRTHAKEPHLKAGQKVERQLVLINDKRAPQPFRASWRLETEGGKTSASGEEIGELAVGETRLVPITFRAPDGLTEGEKQDVALVLDAEIGSAAHADRQALRVYGPPRPDEAPAAVVLHDPLGRTARLLDGLGVAWTRTEPGKTPAKDALLVLGRDALREAPAPLDLGAFVAEGGRVLVMAQSPDWVRRSLGLRVAPAPARRLYPVSSVASELAGIDAFDLRDWNGESTLVEARPEHALASPALPPFGWRWGNRGAVSSAMIEKPHRSGWTPLLEGEWDLAYTPWMELGHGRGRVTWCSLDLEDQAPADPAAERLARQVLTLAARPVTTPRVGEAVYVGSEAGAAALRLAGVNFRTATQVDAKSTLLIVDAATSLSDAQLENHAREGGTVVMLAQPGDETPPRLGVTIRLEKLFLGGVAPEANALTRGLSASDLRWRTPQDTRVLADGAALAANGLLGARTVGKGRIVFVQFDPTAFDLEKRPFYKHTQWRLTRAFTQVLTNLGATFSADRMIFAPQVLRVDLAGPWAVKFTRQLPLAGWERPLADPGVSPAAKEALGDEVDASAWERFVLPANHPRFAEVSGEAVWRREVMLPEEWVGETAMLHIPGIKSFDTVTINGKVVGSTSKDTDPKNPNPWNTPRAYRIPPGVIRAGFNVIAIRQFVPDKDGGVHGRADRFYLQLLVPESRKLNAYVDNWNDDPKYGDDPYRYYRW